MACYIATLFSDLSYGYLTLPVLSTGLTPVYLGGEVCIIHHVSRPIIRHPLSLIGLDPLFERQLLITNYVVALGLCFNSNAWTISTHPHGCRITKGSGKHEVYFRDSNMNHFVQKEHVATIKP